MLYKFVISIELNISDSDKNENPISKYKFKTPHRYCKVCNFKNVNQMDKNSLKNINNLNETCEKCGNKISYTIKLFVISSLIFSNLLNHKIYLI